MNRITKFATGAAVALAIAGTATACDNSQPDADVLQYGYYSPTHVWITYPQPVIVHVPYRVYHSDSRMYSSPSYEKTYTRTHTVTRQTTTTTRSSSTLNKTPQDKIPPGYSKPATSTRTTTTRSTTTRSR